MKFITDFPFLTAKRQRVEFFSCAYLYRVMEDNFHNIVDLSERYSGSQGYDFPLGERAKLFQAAWQVTESASGLYQIMNRSKELFKDFSSYAVLVPNLKISEALRNKRQHIHNNINNLEKADNHLPLHGLIKWTHGVEIGEVEERVRIQIVAVEPLLHKMNFSIQAGFYSDDQNLSSGSIVLQAFDKALNLSKLFYDFESYSQDLQKEMRKNLSIFEAAGAPRMSSLSELDRDPLNVIALARRSRTSAT